MFGLLLAVQLTGLNTPVLVAGHKNPDTDAIVSALALSILLEAQGIKAHAIAQGPPNPETAFVLQRCGLRMPPVQRTVDPNQALILVDHSDAALAPDGLNPRNLVGIFDHHKLGGLASDAPPLVRIEPVGSTATVIEPLFKASAVPITPPLACGLLAAILSDTRGFASPTTTDLDRRSAAQLATIAGIPDPGEMGRSMLQAYASAMARVDDSTLLNTDFKRFKIGAFNIGVAQVEAPDIGFLLKRSASLLQAMERQRRQQGLHTLLLLATDVPRRGSELMVVSDDPHRIADLFGVTLQQGRAWIPGLMSRKRQLVPVLLQGMR